MCRLIFKEIVQLLEAWEIGRGKWDLFLPMSMSLCACKEASCFFLHFSNIFTALIRPKSSLNKHPFTSNSKITRALSFLSWTLFTVRITYQLFFPESEIPHWVFSHYSLSYGEAYPVRQRGSVQRLSAKYFGNRPHVAVTLFRNHQVFRTPPTSPWAGLGGDVEQSSEDSRGIAKNTREIFRRPPRRSSSQVCEFVSLFQRRCKAASSIKPRSDVVAFELFRRWHFAFSLLVSRTLEFVFLRDLCVSKRAYTGAFHQPTHSRSVLHSFTRSDITALSLLCNAVVLNRRSADRYRSVQIFCRSAKHLRFACMTYLQISENGSWCWIR